MKELSVNQVRARLGKLVERVMTPSFHETYNNTALPPDEGTDQILRILSGHMDTIDTYIIVLSENLMNEDVLGKINSFVNPLVAIGFYQRYHMVTQYLCEKNQSDNVLTNPNDKKFFMEMLINFWKEMFLDPHKSPEEHHTA